MDRIGHQLASPTKKPTTASRRILVVGAALILVVAGIAGWPFGAGGYPLELGRPIDASQAIGLAESLNSEEHAAADRLVIRGRVGNVCRASGCWFVLQQVDNGRLYELFVDLKKQASLVVPAGATGRSAIVSGRLVETGSGVMLEADGFRLE